MRNWKKACRKDFRSPFQHTICYLVFLAILPCPALAWDFTPGLPCLLSHTEGNRQIELTYDPTQPLYSVTVSQDTPFPDSPFFAMTFNGPRPNTIASTRHTVSNDGRSVTVTDTGFGNVLDGLQYNLSTTIIVAEEKFDIQLRGAAGPVQAFRDCAADVPSA
ncbi:hypothetical protein ASD8599_03472 [Ascidiaceihabitans donghaensis]|uniref:Uncharacterized protein n=1 Tax=Ascidiaceihabitans donghaensis TaxID=1510460 RepID=A0A2R8BI27_9RHOB|nr:hypothetical protein [Ascidiaceihabitans donghaensis]SPH22726.1 hypothetical protein ASD8599_03472 [Ascidiaceihabitans donghaensis]